MLSDPENEFMRKMTLGGEQGFQDLQKKEIWKSIMAKKLQYPTINEFMNNLNDAEFTEFI